MAYSLEITFVASLEAVIAWLDTGQPEPDHAAEHIWRAIQAVIDAAHPS